MQELCRLMWGHVQSLQVECSTHAPTHTHTHTYTHTHKRINKWGLVSNNVAPGLLETSALTKAELLHKSDISRCETGQESLTTPTEAKPPSYSSYPLTLNNPQAPSHLPTGQGPRRALLGAPHGASAAAAISLGHSPDGCLFTFAKSFLRLETCRVWGGLSESGSLEDGSLVSRGGSARCSQGKRARSPPFPEVNDMHQPSQPYTGLCVVTEGALSEDEVPNRVHRHRDASLRSFNLQPK